MRVDHIDGLSLPERLLQKAAARACATWNMSDRRDSPGGNGLFRRRKNFGARRMPPEELGDRWHDRLRLHGRSERAAARCRPASSRCSELWQRLSGRSGDFAAEEELARRQILERSFSAQRDATVATFYEIAQSDLATRDFSRCRHRAACLTEILAHFPALSDLRAGRSCIREPIARFSRRPSGKPGRRACPAIDG